MEGAAAMSRTVEIIQDGSEARVVGVEEMPEILRGQGEAVLFLGADRSVARVYARLARHMTGLIRDRIGARQEARIERMVDAMLDVDPFDRVEAEIDADNAEMRRDFLTEFEMLTSAEVHDRAGYGGLNKAQTANGWKRAGRVLGVPHRGRDLFPAFEFDRDGQPWPMLAQVLAALPDDLSPWQRAFWLVAPLDALGGAAPIELVRAGDARVLDAAARAGALPVG
jgi:hypothetical protein